MVALRRALSRSIGRWISVDEGGSMEGMGGIRLTVDFLDGDDAKRLIWKEC